MTVHILVVDDEPDVEALVLQKFRHKIRDGAISFLFARDGVEALAALKANGQIDLVVTDINMPRMDGLPSGPMPRCRATSRRTLSRSLPATRMLSTSSGSAARLRPFLPTSPVSPRLWRRWNPASSDRCSMSISRA